MFESGLQIFNNFPVFGSSTIWTLFNVSCSLMPFSEYFIVDFIRPSSSFIFWVMYIVDNGLIGFNSGLSQISSGSRCVKLFSTPVLSVTHLSQLHSIPFLSRQSFTKSQTDFQQFCDNFTNACVSTFFPCASPHCSFSIPAIEYTYWPHQSYHEYVSMCHPHTMWPKSQSRWAA